MRATWSLVRAILVGAAFFLAMTASLCIAFAVAIAGPPTEEEIGEFKAAASEAFRTLGQAAHGASVKLCEAMPSDMSDALCVRDETGEVEQAQAAPPPEVGPLDPLEQAAIAAPPPPRPAPQPPLLGAPSGGEVRTAETQPPPQVRHQRRPTHAAGQGDHRRHRQVTRRRTPPVRAASAPHSHAEAAPLPRVEAPPAPQAAIAAPEPPAAAQQPVAAEAPETPPQEPADAAGHDSTHDADETRAYENWADAWTPFEEATGQSDEAPAEKRN